MQLWSRMWPGRPRDVAVDLGTANTLVHVRGKGVVLREPSVVALDRGAREVLAVGAEAKRMLGRTPPGIEAVRPLKDGVIADFDVAEIMLRHFLHRAWRSRLAPPRVVIGVPSGVTEVERRAVKDAARRAGARRVLLIEEPLAAAIGAELATWEPTGRLVVDIGGGTSEVAVIALNGIVVGRSTRVAGDEIDEAITTYVYHELNLAIGPATAEAVKIAIGSAVSLDGDEACMMIRGRDLLSGLPKAVEMTAPQVREAIVGPVSRIAEAVRLTLEETPPELAGDIGEQGVMLTGGGALLRGIDQLLGRELGMRVRVAEDPSACVVMGAGRALAEEDRFAEVFSRAEGHG